MTINVSDNSPRINYSAALGQTSFPVPFVFFDSGDLKVYLNGVLKSFSIDYTVTGGDGSTGNITLVVGAALSDKIAITRDVPLGRSTDLTSTYSAPAINDQLDTIIAQIADIDDKASRAIQINDYEVGASVTLPSIDSRKGKALWFNSTTGSLEAGPPVYESAAAAAASAASAAAALLSENTAASYTQEGSSQRISQQVDVGFVGDHGDTELFSGAGNAHQDFDIVTVDGVKKLFMVHKVSGDTYGTNERIRISESNFSDDGTSVTPVAFSTEINSGHGQGFTTVVSGSSVTFYITRKTFTSGNGGKGFAKISWRGALTDDTDVTQYQLLGDTGSGHRFEGYKNASPCVSTDADNKYLILHAEIADKMGQANKVLVYDRAEVEAAADPLLVSPLNEFVEHVVPYEDAWVFQGIACDGVTIYQCYGYLAPEHVKFITKTSLGGTLLDLKFASGMLDYYGPDGVRNDATKGVMIRAEYEGVVIRDGKTYIGYVTGFVDDTPIVTATIGGASVNLGCVGTTTGGTQDNPYSHRRWTRTNLAATHGAWSSATTYTMGTNWTEKNKYIIEVGNEDSRSGWFGNTTDWYSMHDSPLGTADASADLSFPAHQAYNINAHVAIGGLQGSTLSAVTLADGELRLHDWNYGSDSTLYAKMQREATSATKRMVLEAQGGARLNLYDDDDATNPGWVQILARDGTDTGILTVKPDGKVTSTKGFQITPDQYSMADDTTQWIPVPAGTNLYSWKFSVTMQQAGANSGAWGIFFVDTDGAPGVVNMAIGANTVSAASAGLNSTTAPPFASYADSKLHVVVGVGGLYLINRLGGTKNYGVTWSA